MGPSPGGRATAGTADRIAPLTVAQRPRHARLARRASRNFNFHMHLPHYAVTTEDARAVHVLARQPIDLSRPHPFTNAGNKEFNTLVWMPPERRPRRRRAGRRLDGLQHAVRQRREPGALLEEHRRRPQMTRARARRHPERRPAAPARSVRGDVPPAPHRRPRAPDASCMRRLGDGRGLGRAPDEPGGATRGSASRSPIAGLEGARRARRTRSTASRGSSGRGWPRARRRSATPARAAPSTGSSRSERATSTSCSPRVAPDQARARSRARRARAGAYETLPGVEAIWRQDCHALSTGKEPFGFRDGISHPGDRGERHSRHQPARAAAQGRRVRPRLPRRDGRLPADAAARRPRPQRHLRRRSASCTSAWRRSAGT